MRSDLVLRDFAPLFRSLTDSLSDFPAWGSRKPLDEGFTPHTDIEETNSHYLLTFDVPGVKKDEIKIDLVGNRLTVSGERRSETKTKDSNKHFVERSFGRFERSFSLPANVNADKVEANYVDGVLQVAVPKADSAKARQITIGESTKGLLS